MTADRPEAPKQKDRWEKMTLTDVGSVAEALHAGGGKLSIMAADVGEEQRKAPGQE